MNEDRLPAPEFENEMRAALCTPPADSAFVSSLRARLVSRAISAKISQPRGLLRLHPAWALALAVLFLLTSITLAVGPQNVLAAVVRIFGYVPGVGIVEDGAALRMLSEPVTQVRENITVCVEQGASDGQRTVLVYSEDGLDLKAANSQGEGAATGSPVFLRLPDGTELMQNGGEGTGWGSGMRFRMLFPPLPAGVDAATLVIPILQSMPAGAAPEDWQLPLRFIPAPADLKVMPVYELTTPESQASLPTTDTAPANEASADGVTIRLEQVAETENGWLLQGTISWKGRPNTTNASFNPFYMKVEADGAPVAVEPASPDMPLPAGEPQPSQWAAATNTKAPGSQYLLSFPSVDVDVTSQTIFNLDLGADPQPGQTWQINQSTQVEGKDVTLASVTLSLQEDKNYNLRFNFTAAPGINAISVTDLDYTPVSSSGSGGGGGGSAAGPLSNDLRFDTLPSGPHRIQLSYINLNLPGPWQIRWTAPASTNTQSTPTSAPVHPVCLTAEQWPALFAAPQQPIPAELGGWVLVQQYVPGQMMPQLYRARLDGSERQDIAFGAWSALSPDGTTAAYITSDGPGVWLHDLATNQPRLVAGSLPPDYAPVFSPDSAWLAFFRSGDGIYIARVDGSDTQRVYATGGVASPSAWSADGSQLYIQALGANGVDVMRIDLASGQAATLFNTGASKGASGALLAPDGSRFAYSGRVFGQINSGVFVADADGANPRSLTALDMIPTITGAWSQDGAWLLISVADYAGDTPVDTPVLVNPDTCQVIPLLNLPGQVTGWSK